MKTKYVLLVLVLISIYGIAASGAYVHAADETETTQATGLEPTSGFVDSETGRPISQEEYEKIVAEQEKGYFEKYPLPTTIAIGGVVGGIVSAVIMVVRRRKKSGLPSTNTGSVPPAPTQQPPVQSPPQVPPTSPSA